MVTRASSPNRLRQAAASRSSTGGAGWLIVTVAVDSDTRPVAAKAPSRKASSPLISPGTSQASATSPASNPSSAAGSSDHSSAP